MKLTKNFIQPIAGAMLCIFLFSCGGKMPRMEAEWFANMP